MLTTIKNQSPFVIAIAMLAVIAFIMLMPSQAIFSKVITDDFKLEYVDHIFKMGFLFLIGYSFIRMLKIEMLAGLSRHLKWRFKYLNLLPAYLIIIAMVGLSNLDLSKIVAANLTLLFLGCLMVSFAEEYLFRGLLQPLFLKRYGSRKNGIFMSILLTSVFFGAFHLLNLTKNDNTGQVLVQVVFAIFIGFFFGVLVLKTNKLVPVAITHALINFSFSLAFLPSLKPMQDDVVDTLSIAPVIVTLPLFIIGLLIYKKLDKIEIIEKLKIEN